ncbi:phosphoenolpyruvate--protein phosphotransferase [Burkholderia multivorans]|uniref:phosphoenolpyruvate--protein phosphotransferase n=1 Tax=Burkholderia multivorans TaxID=87883 RepID=UPI002B2484B8|nr:phosphoenolpyruvate--protein phosphotransferase [Burkholderia multivorans]MEB2569167.1 phosphoenolpyruvate--protein phosphotransferase [Burkholderia multivorans]
MRRAEESQLKSSTHDQIVLLAPLTGPIVALADVPDPVFSGGMFGDGIGIDPLAGKLVAPCAGIVSHLARTGHAVTITTPHGAEVLLHIGIDTVELNGQGFTACVEAGARVEAGDLLIEFDQDAVARTAHSLVSVIAIANSDAFDVIERASGFATAGETPLLTLRGKGEAAAQAAQAGAAAMNEVRRELVLTQPGGLHARPAARAREAARGHDAHVEVHFDGRKAPIESVVGLLGLGAGERATVVLAAEEFTPSDLSSLDRARVTALVMARGGATSHAAIIARQLGIPALVAVGDALYAIPDGTQVVVDASAGRLEHAPTALDVERARHERERLAGVREANRRMAGAAAATADGRAIEVAANIATLDDANTAVDNGADAVGLLRTELMFIHRQAAPTMLEHQQSYQAIVDALQGRTAIIRTLDVGADKEVDYLTLPPEPNPALGLRGIRLAQVRPDLLDDQLQGLLAVKPFGAVRILLPMVTDAGELVRLRKRIDEFARAQGRTEPIEVGVMIEVPSAALLADQLAQHADFLSIGTNDLTQYTLAMDRCQPDLAAQADGLHPAVLRLIDLAVRGAEKHGKWVGVCGALGGDPLAVPILVGLGVTELSVDPVSVPGIKARVRRLDYALCRQRAQDLLALDSAHAVRAASREIWPLD